MGGNMKIIESKRIINVIKEDLIRVVDSLNKTPKLAIIQVEGDIASNSYVKNKRKLGAELGIIVQHVLLPSDTKQEDVINITNQLNNDKDTDGIIIQLPLPSHINERVVLDNIAPDKDVDGLGTTQIGYLNTQSFKTLLPCTALGVIMMLKNLTNLEGKDVVIVNRSHLIGKPLQVILTNENATVTLCHSKTKNLREKMKNADIVITGIGKAKYFDKSYFSDGQIIIDCSMNRGDDGELCGDVRVEGLNDLDVEIASGIGHTGLFTVLSLMINTINAKKMKEI